MTREASPFHRGEALVQTRLGVREEIEPWARKVVRPFLPEEHREFYAALPFLVLAARDGAGRPWATIVSGKPGFANSAEPGSLSVAALPAPGDALEAALVEGADVGVLGIELHTRRRNRVNGHVSRGGAAGFDLAVEQSFGNCPQYIHPRGWRHAPPPVSGAESLRHRSLPERLRGLIEGADTFFIATGHRGEGESPAFGMDASHRGGEPGFVQVVDDRTLLFPDYAGNNHFNTIGNLVLDPRAGLLFVDFECGDLLQLAGRASVVWEVPDPSRFPGARRLVRFELDEAVELRGALPLRFDAAGEGLRSLRVVAKRRESEEVTSFEFAPRDGGPLPAFCAGQYLPLELDVPERSAPVARTYSLSGPPDGQGYRISVKREPHGLASGHLHDRVEVGDVLRAGTPRGDFTLSRAGDRPVALVSAGVGVTPMVSMLHALVQRAVERPVWFVHGARDGRHHALAEEVRQLAASADAVRLHVRYSRPRRDDVPGRDHHGVGRVDAALLEQLVPGLDADWFLCGPIAFMASLQRGLEERGVDPERIHTESFGPVG